MRYLTGVSNQAVTSLQHPRIGLMCQPGNSYHLRIPLYPFFAYDCGGFGGKFDPAKWLRGLDLMAEWEERCLFCVVPDRFDPSDLAGNHRATLEMWGRWADEVIVRGLPAAFVCQNGSTPDDVPVEAAAVFIGGDTRWKLSAHAWAQLVAAKARGRWAHVGRVNSDVRMESVSIMSADSADGTFIKHGQPEAMLRQVVRWLDGLDYEPHLPIFGHLSDGEAA